MEEKYDKNEKGGVSDTAVKEEAGTLRQEMELSRDLTYPGSKISFKVETREDSLFFNRIFAGYV